MASVHAAHDHAGAHGKKLVITPKNDSECAAANKLPAERRKFASSSKTIQEVQVWFVAPQIDGNNCACAKLTSSGGVVVAKMANYSKLSWG
uniref:Uncharacterized protein n=1 Tax=Setaria digitata TaxID=48799 RepID=A0A915PX06_9BILA